MIRKTFAIFLSLAALSACGSFERKVAPHEKELAGMASSKIDVRWAKELPEHGADRFSGLAPAIVGEHAYFAEESGRVSRISMSNGEIQWQKQLDVALSAGPEFVNGKLYLGSPNAEVLALNSEDGSVVWREAVSSEVLSAPKQTGDVVVVHSIDGNIVGLDASNGNLIWTFTRQVPILTLRGTGSPLIVEDRVIIGLSSGKLVALSALDGRVVWESVISVPQGRSELERIVDIDGALRYDNGTIYVVGFQGRVAAVTIESGRLLWTRDMSSFLGLNIDENNLYVTDADGRIWALDRNNGATLWMQDKLEQLASTVVALQGDKLVVGDFDGNLYWLTRSDGRIVTKVSYLKLIETAGIFNPADPDELKKQYRRSTYEQDFGAVNIPRVTGDALLVTYRSGVVAYLSLKP